MTKLALCALLLLARPALGDEQPRFEVNPVLDASILSISLGFSGLLSLVNTTGEIRPQQIAPDFQVSHLLSIDRSAVTQTLDPNAGTFSNMGLFTVVAFAAFDPILTGVRESSFHAGLVDAVMYAESLSVTLAVGTLVKMAVRRPRPVAYKDWLEHKDEPNYMAVDTEKALSFFSLHSATCATVTATASYLAFKRWPHGARPWVTLGVGTALTAFVGYERVRNGSHFPSDVLAGAMVGAGLGLLVPYLHRTHEVVANVGGGALTFSFGGSF